MPTMMLAPDVAAASSAACSGYRILPAARPIRARRPKAANRNPFLFNCSIIGAKLQECARLARRTGGRHARRPAAKGTTEAAQGPLRAGRNPAARPCAAKDVRMGDPQGAAWAAGNVD